MQTQPHNRYGIDVASILPADWNPKSDVLLIVGEGACFLAQPFIKHGLTRVFAMFPRPLEPEESQGGCVVITSRGELQRAINLMGKESANRFALLRTPSCSLTQSETDSIHDLTTRLLKRQYANDHTHDYLAPLWAKNGLKNLRHLGRFPMVTDFKNQFRDVPLIIVGAGPSLAVNINTLREAQGKAIIICVARALKSLQNVGIWPDFAMTLDAYDIKSHFNGIAMDEIPSLILSATSHPNLFEDPHTNRISFTANTVAEGWMFEPEDRVVEMASSGSVSCSAMSVGLHWGCNPIMLVGQDLSFAGGQFYHGKGTDGETHATYDDTSNTWSLSGYSDELAHTLEDQISDDGIRFQGTEVPGYFGGTVPTNPTFASFRTWFELTAADESDRTRMINCTEGGARINGMQHIPLRTALQDLPCREIDVRTVIQKVTEATPLSDRHSRMNTKANQICRQVREAIHHAKKAVALIDQARVNPAAIQALQTVEQKLSRALKKAFVINLMAQDEIRGAMAEGQKAGSMSESLDATQKLYEVIILHGERLLAHQ
jgi:hypothetical protein